MTGRTVTPADLDAARALLPGEATPFVVAYPGPSDSRWPARHFAEVVSRCVRGGALVALVGRAAESELLHDIWRRADQRLSWGAADVVIVLDGIDDSALRGVLALSDVVVGNDDGIRQLAQAIGTPTVFVAEMSPDEVVDEVGQLLG